MNLCFGRKNLVGKSAGAMSNKEKLMLWCWIQHNNPETRGVVRETKTIGKVFQDKQTPSRCLPVQSYYFNLREMLWDCWNNYTDWNYTPQKTTPLFLPNLLLNLQTAQVPLLRQSRPVYWLFHEPPLPFLKIEFFSESQKFQFFLSLNPIPSFKSN